MLIFNTNLCYLCSQLLVSHRSISFFLFPIIRIHFPLCNRFLPVYSFFPFCFEKFNKLQLKFTNWIYLFFSLLHFWNIYYTMRNQDSWLLLFTGSVPRGVFVNIVHRKTWETRREIMRMHDFCASRSVLLFAKWALTTDYGNLLIINTISKNRMWSYENRKNQWQSNPLYSYKGRSGTATRSVSASLPTAQIKPRSFSVKWCSRLRLNLAWSW